MKSYYSRSVAPQDAQVLLLGLPRRFAFQTPNIPGERLAEQHRSLPRLSGDYSHSLPLITHLRTHVASFIRSLHILYSRFA